jgi:hypothetical protein
MNLPLWNDKDGLSEYYSEEKIVLRACGDVGTHFNSLHARLCVSACMYACVSAGVRVCVCILLKPVFLQISFLIISINTAAKPIKRRANEKIMVGKREQGTM